MSKYDVSLLETDNELGMFSPTDAYRFDIDNRPYRRLLVNDIRLAAAIEKNRKGSRC